MSYQLALAGRHLRWKPHHCIDLCLPCCAPALHVVPADIGWEAFPLDNTSLHWLCLTLLNSALQPALARDTWEACQVDSPRACWPRPALLRTYSACRTSWHWLGGICVGNHVTVLASACLAAPLPCMSYQLALAGKHLRWKPRHCIGPCLPCCVPDLHVVPAGIGWEAFPLEIMSMR